MPGLDGSIPNALMQPVHVVMLEILTDQVIEMLQAEALEMIEAFTLDRSDPSFGERVHDWDTTGDAFWLAE